MRALGFQTSSGAGLQTCESTVEEFITAQNGKSVDDTEAWDCDTLKDICSYKQSMSNQSVIGEQSGSNLY